MCWRFPSGSSGLWTCFLASSSDDEEEDDEEELALRTTFFFFLITSREDDDELLLLLLELLDRELLLPLELVPIEAGCERLWGFLWWELEDTWAVESSERVDFFSRSYCCFLLLIAIN